MILADSSKFDQFASGHMFGFEQVHALGALGTRVIVRQEGGAAAD